MYSYIEMVIIKYIFLYLVVAWFDILFYNIYFFMYEQFTDQKTP